jgi:hypothetical protein
MDTAAGAKHTASEAVDPESHNAGTVRQQSVTATDAGSTAADAKDAVEDNLREAFRSRWMEWGARVGMVARSIVYLLIAVLAIQVAFGHHKEADQNGALRTVARSTGGPALLGLLAAAFGTYALWRLAVVFFGEAGKRDGRTRLEAAIGFVGYGGMCITAISLMTGSGNQAGGSAKQATAFTARVMRHDGGRAAVIIAGLVLAGAGLVLAIDGLRKSFLEKLDLSGCSPRWHAFIGHTGLIGNVARGVVFVLIGALVVDAGWTYDPQKSRGLDGALKTLAGTTAGPWLLLIVAAGLLAYVLYSLMEARYRITRG